MAGMFSERITPLCGGKEKWRAGDRVYDTPGEAMSAIREMGRELLRHARRPTAPVSEYCDLATIHPDDESIARSVGITLTPPKP